MFQNKNISLLDIIDLKFLQNFQDSFSKSVNVAIIMVDNKGPITKPSNFTDFCVKYTRGSKLGYKRCNECDIKGGKIASQKGRAVIYDCHAGLTDFAVPIMLNGKHIASILGGQVLTNEPNESSFREIAKELNIDENLYLEELKKIKIIPKQQVQSAANLLFIFANSISELASKNLELRIKSQKEKDIAQKESLLREIMASCVSTFNFEKQINSIVTQTGEFFNADRCFFIEHDPTGIKNLNIKDYAEYRSSNTIKSHLTRPITQADTCRFVKTSQKKITTVVDDIRKIELSQAAKQMLINDLSVKSYIISPIYYKNVVYGSLVMHYVKKFKKFHKDEIELLEAIANNSAAVIRQSKLYSEIEKNEKYTRNLLDNINDVIITVDSDFIIESCNPAVENLWGYEPSECIGFPLTTLLNYNCDDSKNIFCFDANSIYGIKKNGEKFPVEINISTLVIDDKNINLLVIRDITERKKIDKMKNEFVSTVSHELRTPLTSLKGALGLIQGGKMGDVPEKVKGLIDIANNNCSRLINIINDILDIEKIEAGKMDFEISTIELMSIINQAIQLNLQFSQKFHVKIKLEETLNEVFVQADINRLTQVLTNLLSNAIKFSKPQSSVSISIVRIDGKIRVSVTNYGIEISDEFKKRIFQKFAQADSSDARQKGGTGLGLSISKAIIEKMNGDIGFISKNQKTTFYFDLPELLEKDKGTTND